jgi:hypothetical protein
MLVGFQADENRYKGLTGALARRLSGPATRGGRAGGRADMTA